ncbi:related to TPO4-Proposed vacuolar polyamine transporter [Phialocephala subalpina]|uniref:Related to TPO4-Proposed vacuolar polyamine transporter n=1 Tax=Phialocephala subalpina TaxID=576137 RepID=A0A1L7XP81_9HELO|nr:related to TPO4-Proposed vacuolar polyamine transporter [Phialocephala subalpina]
MVEMDYSNGGTSAESTSVLEKAINIKPHHSAMTSDLPQVTMDLDTDDKDNPRNWSPRKKALTACFVLVTVFTATLGTPIYVAAIPGAQQHFNLLTTLAILPGSLYAYGLSFGALIGTAACEIYGRRIVYQVSVPLSLIFTIVGGASKNYATLAVARSLAGLFSGPCLTVGAGIINDLWDVRLEKTGTSFVVLFVLCIVWATQAGPMISASVVQDQGWRWTFWVMTILAGIVTVWAFLIPETYHPQVVRAKAKKEGREVESRGSKLYVFLVAVGRPLHMIIIEPIVFPTSLVLAVTQSVVFAYYINYALLYERVYHFTQYQVGMAFGALLVGSFVSIPIIAAFDKLTYQKARSEALRLGKTVAPEMRLYPAMVGSITLPISLFWLAWTGKSSIHWIVPTLSGILFGFSYVVNVMCLPVYNNDVYGARFGASVLAASTFIRFLLSSSFLLFTNKMVDNLGFAWATSLLGFITVAMIPIPWVFFKWGPVLRTKSRYLKDEVEGEGSQ